MDRFFMHLIAELDLLLLGLPHQFLLQEPHLAQKGIKAFAHRFMLDQGIAKLECPSAK
jgi:hypothetical protein